MKLAAGIGENHAIKDAISQVDFDVVLTESETELMDLLLQRKVDASVRGSLNASGIMGRLREDYPEMNRASILSKGYKFSGSCGIDEGHTLERKVQIITSGS